MVKFKLIQRRNPLKPEEPNKWFASKINLGMVTQDEISDDLVLYSSLSKGDISNTVENLLEAVPKKLLDGKSVNLRGFGTFWLSFSSKGVVNPKDFHPNMISRARVLFRPSKELRKKIADVKFEKMKAVSDPTVSEAENPEA